MDYGLLLSNLRAEQERIRLDSRHCYWRDGKRRKGVTSAVKVLDAPKLDDWRVRVQVEGTARAAFANPPAFGQDEEGYVSLLVDIAAEMYEAQRIADAAKDIGIAVHSLIEHHIRTMLGEEPERPKVSDEAAFVFAGWPEWAASVGFKPLIAEARVYHATEDYCGTLDALAVVDGQVTVLDWKPKDAIYPERRLQLTAYAKALESMGWPLPERAVVAMPQDGGSISMVTLDDDPEETFDSFRACLQLSRWLSKIRNGGRRAAA